MTGRARTPAGFVLGVIVGIGVSVAGAGLFSTWSVGPFDFAIPVIGFAGGGAIAGRSLGVGVPGVVGFAVAYAFSLPIAIFNLITLQGLGGNESFESLAFYFGSWGAVAFGIMGVVGTAIAGLRREIVASGVVFGGAGFLGGSLIAASSAVTHGPSTLASVLFYSSILAYLALPPALGGLFLARRVATPEEDASGSADR